MKKIISLLLCFFCSPLNNVSGARLFNDAGTEYLERGDAVVSNYPFTISAWVYTDEAALTQSVVAVTDKDAPAKGHFFRLSSSGNANYGVQDFGFNGVSATTNYSANTWHHICAVGTSVTSRSAFIDGGSKGTTTVSKAPSSLDTTSIGRLIINGSDTNERFSGRLAVSAIHSVVLTDNEVSELALGTWPEYIQAGSIALFVPIFGVDSPELDLSGNGNDMTVTGSPSKADGPPVFLFAGGN